MLTHDARCSCAFVAEQNFFACFAKKAGSGDCPSDPFALFRICFT